MATRERRVRRASRSFQDERAAARTLAQHIADALAAKPALVLGLPTGRTPIRLYHELASLAEHGHADFSRVTTFNLDEFLGMPADHPGSYRTFMQAHLFVASTSGRSRSIS